MKSVKTATLALVLVVIGSVLFLGLANSEPSAAGAQADAHDTWMSEAELQKLAGRAADRCVHAGPGRKLCGWTIQGGLVRAGGDAQDARAEVVKMICELPVGATDDVRGTCRVHAQGDRTPGAASDDRPHVSAPGPRTNHEVVWKKLSRAHTVAELSHLVGAMPNTCRSQLENDSQQCEWRLDEQEGPLAALAPAEGVGALRCGLPLDGRDREPTSCGVVRLD